MNMQKRHKSAKGIYAGSGVDVDVVMKRLKNTPVSMHCWQGDDVMGFEGADNLLGGIQVTGNYPGKARNPREFMTGTGKALSLIPGKHRINPHVSYAIFTSGKKADRDALKLKHFAKRMELTGKRGLGLDPNLIMFSHPKAKNATLSSEDPEIRKFWTNHCKACARISQYFAEELGSPCSISTWVPDGFKDILADRMSPRARLKDSLDQTLAMDYGKSKMLIAVESKAFGIGMEDRTVDSHESYMNCATARGIIRLLDGGHFHPTEMISGRIFSILLLLGKAALYVSRPVRWDGDHVVLLDNEAREIAREIVKNDPDRVLLALDFFDANINRICAWVVGMRNMRKTLLYILLMPNEKLARLQKERRFTELMMEQEGLKTYPFGDIWDYFRQINQVLVGEQWSKEAEAYKKEVLSRRG